LLKQEGAPMGRVDLSTSECDGQVAVALRGNLDVTDAASVAVVRGEIAASRPLIIVGQAVLLPAAAQQQGLRFPSLTQLVDIFCARAAARAAVGNSGRFQLAAAPAAARSAALAAP
jgi:hypothetical protein